MSAARSRYTPDAHYPSWGFGTTGRHRLSSAPSYLITPHGDLELARPPTPGPPPSPLITPHGDLEPLLTLTVDGGAGLLITPHGDLEPCLPRTS